MRRQPAASDARRPAGPSASGAPCGALPGSPTTSTAECPLGGPVWPTRDDSGRRIPWNGTNGLLVFRSARTTWCPHAPPAGRSYYLSAAVPAGVRCSDQERFEDLRLHDEHEVG